MLHHYLNITSALCAILFWWVPIPLGWRVYFLRVKTRDLTFRLNQGRRYLLKMLVQICFSVIPLAGLANIDMQAAIPSRRCCLEVLYPLSAWG